MNNEEQLIASILYCTLIFVMSVIFKKFPPKEINSLYGYRTRRSMSNKVIWKSANVYATLYMLHISLWSFVIPCLVYFIFPEQNFMITVFGNTLLIFSVMWSTEKYLNKHFDKNGNPK
ncbi:SdpI/YhfL family protein [Ulvibacter sp. MAR_2010_11]|uniref:SdpI family protein n=1 Tax=Ulvibacter sp. MAR_2010_11 TaxID=1250229 RepID=UPI000C2CD363|nr:SdpI family protein [Ulvibacter sp. MAR_2010_11]PKA83056.1 SdpI/YhfL family protein [Ulvibacter sp. MAR_2010_11]